LVAEHDLILTSPIIDEMSWHTYDEKMFKFDRLKVSEEYSCEEFFAPLGDKFTDEEFS
jgi:hypothetical protein